MWYGTLVGTSPPTTTDMLCHFHIQLHSLYLFYQKLQHSVVLGGFLSALDAFTRFDDQSRRIYMEQGRFNPGGKDYRDIKRSTRERLGCGSKAPDRLVHCCYWVIDGIDISGLLTGRGGFAYGSSRSNGRILWARDECD